MNGKILFEDYRVKEVEFLLNTEFDNEDPIKIDLNLAHAYSINDDSMTVTLGVKVFEDAEKNNYPFEIKVIVDGLFYKDDDDVDFKAFLPNALAILFPYVRALVSSYTANSNVQPLILPTINMMSYLKENNDKEEDL